MDQITIGNAGGYWGDDPGALHRQVYGGRLDFITMDFLAEVTMSIMQKQRSRDPALGYAKDFIPMLESVLEKALGDKTCIITNAGGVNPEACAAAITAMAKRLGLNPKIAVVYGDDILDRLPTFAKQSPLTNMDTGAPFAAIHNRVESANLYFGAVPVVEALKFEPDIIITGRVTDTGITIAPMIHRFGWSLSDWDKLAAGIVAGHIIECGSQSTGGNFTDWHKVKNYRDIGYPIIEMDKNGEFVVTKHIDSGGLVSLDTVREQLFYEMGDPGAYITPDVVADFASIKLEEVGPNRVKVSGIRGFEPTPLYKVSIAYSDGHKTVGDIAISGPEARAKAEAFAKIFWQKAGDDYTETSTEFFGWNACHRNLGHAADGEEIILRVGARDQDPKKLRQFAKLVPSLILSGPPGVCVLGGVPKIQDVVSYWPALMPKELANPVVALYDGGLTQIKEVTTTKTGQFEAKAFAAQIAENASRELPTETPTSALVPLVKICLARSGDKGDTANIGVMARSEAAYHFLGEYLTAQRVKDWFQELCKGKVTRYSLPNMQGYNFLLDHALGGGGTMTLRTDAQGKTFAQAVLRQEVAIPADVLASIR